MVSNDDGKIPDRFCLGEDLNWDAPWVDVSLWVELPFWLMVDNTTLAIEIEGHEFQVALYDNYFELYFKEITDSRQNVCYRGPLKTHETLGVSNSLTLAGTDGTTMTFPGSSKTLMAADYSNAGTPPTWNQNTTGTAANVTGTVATANGGTGATANANAANGVVILDGSARLPAVDGSQLTNLPSAMTKVGSSSFTAQSSAIITGLSSGKRYKVFIDTTLSETAEIDLIFSGDNNDNHYAYNTIEGNGPAGNLPLCQSQDGSIYPFCAELFISPSQGSMGGITIVYGMGIYTSARDGFNAMSPYPLAGVWNYTTLTSITLSTSAGTMTGTMTVYELN